MFGTAAQHIPTRRQINNAKQPGYESHVCFRWIFMSVQESSFRYTNIVSRWSKHLRNLAAYHDSWL
jgi:hypothetical protein